MSRTFGFAGSLHTLSSLLEFAIAPALAEASRDQLSLRKTAPATVTTEVHSSPLRKRLLAPETRVRLLPVERPVVFLLCSWTDSQSWPKHIAADMCTQVFGGVLVHQVRRSAEHRCDERFAVLSRTCAAAAQVKPAREAQAVTGFGQDPAFNEQSVLFDPLLTNAVGDFYNTSAASGEVDIKGRPRAFFPQPLPVFSRMGFPVVFLVRSNISDLSTNCMLPWTSSSQARGPAGCVQAQSSSHAVVKQLQLLYEANFLDTLTHSIEAVLLTYNARLRVIGFATIAAHQSDTGQFGQAVLVSAVNAAWPLNMPEVVTAVLLPALTAAFTIVSAVNAVSSGLNTFSTAVQAQMQVCLMHVHCRSLYC